MPVTAALLLLAIGCGQEAPDPTADTSLATTQIAESPSVAIRPKSVDREHPVVVVDTNLGVINIRLDAERAPGTVRNFLNYVNDGFYDNTLVHYVDADKTIIAGGYAADRTQKPTRQSIRNEAHNGVKNTRGTVAMARDASLIDSATSQFFINLADAPQRDYQGDSAEQYGYCVFGEITKGLDVAQQISQTPTTSLANDLVRTPDPPVLIKTIRVTE